MQGCNVIAKGSFTEFKFNDFVSLRQYLLVREGNAKFLLLKLSNDSEYSVTGIKLSVEQLDVRGNSISKDVINWKEFTMAPGEKAIPKEKIPMKENCVEVKINLLSADYGDYVYRVKSNELIVTYSKKRTGKKRNYSEYTNGKKSVSFEREFKIPKTLVAVAMVLVALSLVATLIHVTLFKKNNNEFLWSGMTYEFLDRSHEEGSPIVITGFNNLKSDLHIPKDVKGYPVAGIKPGVFNGNNRIQTLVVDANMEIPKEAFMNCKNLETVDLNGALIIGENAFAGCTKLNSVKAYNLDRIKVGAFNQCKNLSTFEISNQEKALKVESGAFALCLNLKNLSIDQPIDYTESTDFLSGLDGLVTLTLNNYNNQPNIVRPLSILFGGIAPLSLQDVKITDIDVISNDFCYNFNTLTSIKLSGLKDTVVHDRAFSGCTALSSFDFGFENDALEVTGVGEESFKGTAISTFDATYLTSIGKGAFSEATKLETIATQASIDLKTIGINAFKGCVALKSFDLPSKVSIIEEGTFSGCISLANFNLDQRTTLKEIRGGAFENCVALTDVVVPNTVIYIGDKTFFGCTGITSLSLSNRLNEIGVEAFAGCIGITEINLSNRILSIGKGAFTGCNALAQMTLPFIGGSREDNTYLGYIFGSSDVLEVITPNSLKKVTILEGKVEDNSFYGHSEIREIVLSEKVEEIGASAFTNCLNLRKIHLPSTLKVIDDTAFNGCNLLLEIYDNSKLRIKRGDVAYGGIAKNALAVYVPGDVELERTTVNDFEFIRVPEEGWYVTDYIGENGIAIMPDFVVDSQNLIDDSYFVVPYLFEKRVDINEITLVGVKNLGTCAFLNNTVISKITVDRSCRLDCLDASTFKGCTSLKSIKFADSSIRSLGNHLFDGCNALEQVVLPQGLVEIGEYAFNGCSNLVSFALPQTVSKIGVYAFSGCSNLGKIEIGANVADLGYGALSNCNALKEITLPFIGDGDDELYAGYVFGLDYGVGLKFFIDKITILSATEVKSGAFNGFSNLKEVAFNSSLEKIETNSFSGCNSLSSVVLQGLNTIENGVFSGCVALSKINLDGVKEIGDMAFYSTALQEVVFSDSLISLGSSVFENCKSLKRVDLSNAVLCTEIPSNAFAYCTELSIANISGIKTINQNAFNGCKSLLSIDFNGVEKIKNNAFLESGLTGVILPSTLSEMGNMVFGNCEKLERVIFNNCAINVVPTSSFASCTQLSSVNFIGNSIKNIGNRAFSGCAKLTEIALPSTIESIEDLAFADCTEIKTVKLSKNLSSLSVDAFYGCENILEVYNPSTLTITRGGVEYGGIAYNAIIVHDSLLDVPLKEQTINGMQFYYAESEGECCLYSYSGNSSVLKFSRVYLGGRYYNSYWIYKNVFAGNENLIEVDTGVVSEISNGAFSGCVNLKKATVSSTLNMIKEDAFNDCQKLWEVRDNNTNFDISVGSSICGGVAYYALVVNDSVSYAEQGDYKFVYYGGSWYLYGVVSGEQIILPEYFTYNGYRVNNYSLFYHPNIYGSGVLYNCNLNVRVVVPTSVKNIKQNAFNANNYYDRPIIYYKGGVTEWNNATDFNQNFVNVYYYSDCVHNYDLNTKNWTWNNGTASHLDTPTEWERYKEPTCTSVGKERRVCRTCNANLQERNVNILPHNMTDWVIDYDSTCTALGRESRHCKNCSTANETRSIAKKAHECEWKVAYDSTCTSLGRENYTCKNCNSVTSYRNIAKKPHNMTDWVIDYDSTCTALGRESRHCKNCSTANETRSIAKKAHECEWKVAYDSTCTTLGKENYTCKNCHGVFDQRDIPLKSHDMTDWAVVTPSTCTTLGQEERHCKNCNTAKEVNEIPKKSHDMTDWTVVTSPTCITLGQEERHCKNCDTVDEVKDIDMISHEYGLDDKCINCGISKEEQEG